MNIDLTITEEKQVVKEIELPYCSQNACYFSMITKDQMVIRLKVGGDWMGYELEMHTPDSIHYKSSLIQTVNAKMITESELFAQYNAVKEKIFQAVESTLQTA